MITKEMLEERLGQLEQDRQMHLANLHAVSGAIQDCRYWLEQLQQEVNINT